MEHDFLTWGNFITWVICSIFIYLSLNFRLYMIFHHPGRKLKAKVRARRAPEIRKPDYPSHIYNPREEPDCPQGAHCFMRKDGTCCDETFQGR